MNNKGEKKNHLFLWVYRRNDRHKPLSLQRHQALGKDSGRSRREAHLNPDTFCYGILNTTCFLKQVSTKPGHLISEIQLFCFIAMLFGNLRNTRFFLVLARNKPLQWDKEFPSRLLGWPERKQERTWTCDHIIICKSKMLTSHWQQDFRQIIDKHRNDFLVVSSHTKRNNSNCITFYTQSPSYHH